MVRTTTTRGRISGDLRSRMKDLPKLVSTIFTQTSVALTSHAAADRTYVSKALGAEWYTMTTKQKVAAATEAEMVAENEDGDMVKEALATPLKREKYVKGHLDNLSTIV